MVTFWSLGNITKYLKPFIYKAFKAIKNITPGNQNNEDYRKRVCKNPLFYIVLAVFAFVCFP